MGVKKQKNSRAQSGGSRSDTAEDLSHRRASPRRSRAMPWRSRVQPGGGMTGNQEGDAPSAGHRRDDHATRAVGRPGKPKDSSRRESAGTDGHLRAAAFARRGAQGEGRNVVVRDSARREENVSDPRGRGVNSRFPTLWLPFGPPRKPKDSSWPGSPETDDHLRAESFARWGAQGEVSKAVVTDEVLRERNVSDEPGRDVKSRFPTLWLPFGKRARGDGSIC